MVAWVRREMPPTVRTALTPGCTQRTNHARAIKGIIRSTTVTFDCFLFPEINLGKDYVLRGREKGNIIPGQRADRSDAVIDAMTSPTHRKIVHRLCTHKKRERRMMPC